ncbi:hypothetical protein niasHT_034325 [Heterodera trifolii]|uniref:Uncharacterized protein n=1 Tax=Heterodera trifolii TaxID=157864 RepID=A0ABD2HUP0_9BILA
MRFFYLIDYAAEENVVTKGCGPGNEDFRLFVLIAIADPQQPCSSQSLRVPNARDCIRNAYKKVAPGLLEQSGAELFRPGTGTSVSGSGSSSASTHLSRAKRPDREKGKLKIVRHVGQKYDPNCQTRDQLLK